MRHHEHLTSLSDLSLKRQIRQYLHLEELRVAKLLVVKILHIKRYLLLFF